MATAIAPAVKKPHLSASQLNTFFNCPEAYRRRYIEGEIIPPGIALLKGKSVHAPAEVNFRQKIESREDLPLKDFESIADAAFTAELAAGYQLSPEEEAIGKQKVLGEARDAAVRMAEFHGREQAPDYQPVLVEAPFTVELPGARDLLGIIDLADESRRVVDLKTASRKKTQSEVDSNLQLTVYAVGHRVLTGEPPAELRLDTIVQGKKGLTRDVVSTDRTAGDFSALAQRLNIVTQSIEAGIFPPAAPGHWMCNARWCGFAATCPYINAERAQRSEAD